jgi:hypothetical protein
VLRASEPADEIPLPQERERDHRKSIIKMEKWSRRSDLNLSRFAGVNEAKAEWESAGEILSEAKDLYESEPFVGKVEPTIGLEPMTCRLRIDCSTN